MFKLKDDPIVQCGYGAFSTRWLQRIFGKDKEPFLRSCQLHDARYGQKTGTRLEADRELLHNMLNASYSAWDRARAWIFYGIVRGLGKKVWDDE